MMPLFFIYTKLNNIEVSLGLYLLYKTKIFKKLLKDPLPGLLLVIVRTTSLFFLDSTFPVAWLWQHNNQNMEQLISKVDEKGQTQVQTLQLHSRSFSVY